MFNDKDELKARIEDLQKDLDFYLCYRRKLSSVSKRMAAVVEKEIEELETKIEQLKSLL